MINYLEKFNAVSWKLVEKTDCKTNIKEIGSKILCHDKCITTPEFTKLTK